MADHDRFDDDSDDWGGSHDHGLGAFDFSSPVSPTDDDIDVLDVDSALAAFHEPDQQAGDDEQETLSRCSWSPIRRARSVSPPPSALSCNKCSCRPRRAR